MKRIFILFLALFLTHSAESQTDDKWSFGFGNSYIHNGATYYSLNFNFELEKARHYLTFGQKLSPDGFPAHGDFNFGLEAEYRWSPIDHFFIKPFVLAGVENTYSYENYTRWQNHFSESESIEMRFISNHLGFYHFVGLGTFIDVTKNFAIKADVSAQGSFTFHSVNREIYETGEFVTKELKVDSRPFRNDNVSSFLPSLRFSVGVKYVFNKKADH